MRRFHPHASVLISSIALGAALGCACANKTTPSGTATGGSTTPSAVHPATPAGPPQEMTVQVINSFPHDHAAFTQGLLFADGKLYESTGLVGQSSLRRVDLTSGHVETQIAIDAPIFAEGLALAGDNLFQISWQNGRAFVYRKADFSRVREHSYSGEGWGLAFDGQRLVMSDGTAHLTFRDPGSFAITGGVDVARAGTPVRNLNELEWVDGQVYANVWQTNVIVRIDPTSGAVTGWIDAAGLLSSEERVGTDVLNGIAYAPARGTFFITGKLWPRLFEVKFVAH